MGGIFKVFREELLSESEVVQFGRCAGGERGRDTFGMGEFQCPIDLIGGYVIEALALVLFGHRFPVQLRRLQQGQSSHDVGLCEGEGIFDRAVHVAFSGEVYDAGHFLLLHKGVHSGEVTDVGTNEAVIGFVFYIFEVHQIAGIGQFIHIDNAVLRVLVDEEAHNVASDKAGSAGDENSIHKKCE